MSSDRTQAWTEFTATVCCVCQGAKPLNNGFCRACYYSLPKAMKQALWQRGYEAAHQAAREWLQQKKQAVSA